MTAPQPGLLARLGPTGIAAAVTAVLILFGIGAMIVPALTDGGSEPPAAAAAPEPAASAPSDPTSSSSPDTVASAAPTSAAPTTAKAATPTLSASFNSGHEDRVVQLVNNERRKARCEALRMHPQLRAAARSHSADMVTHDFNRSEGSDGSSPEDRVRQAGYTAFADELVTKGGDPSGVVKSWLRNSDNRKILLDCATKSIGVGAAMRGRTPYWTVDTGRA
ncbi:CAP domain-containing protein [Dactylosporangium sp. NPDC000521]|uniref:CAP domain-containing protein n=1 Tax=Dactylosporangium sp. NPDC000521 TaxID=3363975 RepID=UPI0036912D0E